MTISKGKFDAQAISEFKHFYNIKFHPWRQDWIRQVVERRLQELEEEQETEGLKAWSKYIEKHCPDPEPNVKELSNRYPRTFQWSSRANLPSPKYIMISGASKCSRGHWMTDRVSPASMPLVSQIIYLSVKGTQHFLFLVMLEVSSRPQHFTSLLTDA